MNNKHNSVKMLEVQEIMYFILCEILRRHDKGMLFGGLLHRYVQYIKSYYPEQYKLIEDHHLVMMFHTLLQKENFKSSEYVNACNKLLEEVICPMAIHHFHTTSFGDEAHTLTIFRRAEWGKVEYLVKYYDEETDFSDQVYISENALAALKFAINN